MTETIQILCEGTKPMILHRYTLRELLSMWDHSLPLRAQCDELPYYDGDHPVLPRAVLQAVLTRSAYAVGVDLTKKRRLIPGLRIVEPMAPLLDRDDNPANVEVDARTGNGARTFRRIESVTCVLPRFDRWRFRVQIQLGANFDWRLARKIWDTAGRLGIGDGAPGLGQFIIQSWSAVSPSRRRSMRERISP